MASLLVWSGSNADFQDGRTWPTAYRSIESAMEATRDVLDRRIVYSPSHSHEQRTAIVYDVASNGEPVEIIEGSGE